MGPRTRRSWEAPYPRGRLDEVRRMATAVSSRQSRVEPPRVLSLSELSRSPLYSEELGIDLRKKSDDEYFKWFLASILFGARISGTIAKNTYRTFARYGLLTPDSILAAGWDFLVNPIMREGGYVRYDGRKSTQVLADCEHLLSEYEGSLTRLHERARDEKNLEELLLAFYGVGPTTVNIFLRELRPYWRKARPVPLAIVQRLARKYGVDLEAVDISSKTFARIEAGLIRMRRMG
jgi:endonuclease III